MSVNQALMEAVNRLKTAETEVIEAREQVANLFVLAAKTQPVTGLAMMTGIGRTTIYWLMRTWSTNSENRNYSNRR
jgi:hypothetical protein